MDVKSIGKDQFIRQISIKAGKTFAETQIVINAMEAVVREQLLANGLINLPNLVQIRKIVRPALPARQRVCPFDGKLRNYKARPAKNILRVKALRALKNVVEGSSVQNL